MGQFPTDPLQAAMERRLRARLEQRIAMRAAPPPGTDRGVNVEAMLTGAGSPPTPPPPPAGLGTEFGNAMLRGGAMLNQMGQSIGFSLPGLPTSPAEVTPPSQLPANASMMRKAAYGGANILGEAAPLIGGAIVTGGATAPELGMLGYGLLPGAQAAGGVYERTGSVPAAAAAGAFGTAVGSVSPLAGLGKLPLGQTMVSRAVKVLTDQYGSKGASAFIEQYGLNAAVHHAEQLSARTLAGLTVQGQKLAAESAAAAGANTLMAYGNEGIARAAGAEPQPVDWQRAAASGALPVAVMGGARSVYGNLAAKRPAPAVPEPPRTPEPPQGIPVENAYPTEPATMQDWLDAAGVPRPPTPEPTPRVFMQDLPKAEGGAASQTVQAQAAPLPVAPEVPPGARGQVLPRPAAARPYSPVEAPAERPPIAIDETTPHTQPAEAPPRVFMQDLPKAEGGAAAQTVEARTGPLPVEPGVDPASRGPVLFRPVTVRPYQPVEPPAAERPTVPVAEPHAATPLADRGPWQQTQQYDLQGQNPPRLPPPGQWFDPSNRVATTPSPGIVPEGAGPMFRGPTPAEQIRGQAGAVPTEPFEPQPIIKPRTSISPKKGDTVTGPDGQPARVLSVGKKAVTLKQGGKTKVVPQDEFNKTFTPGQETTNVPEKAPQAGEGDQGQGAQQAARPAPPQRQPVAAEAPAGNARPGVERVPAGQRPDVLTGADAAKEGGTPFEEVPDRKPARRPNEADDEYSDRVAEWKARQTLDDLPGASLDDLILAKGWIGRRINALHSAAERGRIPQDAAAFQIDALNREAEAASIYLRQLRAKEASPPSPDMPESVKGIIRDIRQQANDPGLDVRAGFNGKRGWFIETPPRTPMPEGAERFYVDSTGRQRWTLPQLQESPSAVPEQSPAAVPVREAPRGGEEVRPGNAQERVPEPPGAQGQEAQPGPQPGPEAARGVEEVTPRKPGQSMFDWADSLEKQAKQRMAARRRQGQSVIPRGRNTGAVPINPQRIADDIRDVIHITVAKAVKAGAVTADAIAKYADRVIKQHAPYLKDRAQEVIDSATKLAKSGGRMAIRGDLNETDIDQMATHLLHGAQLGSDGLKDWVRGHPEIDYRQWASQFKGDDGKQKYLDLIGRIEQRAKQKAAELIAQREAGPHAKTLQGYPAWVQTPEDIVKFEQNWLDMAEHGKVGRKWYETSSRAIKRAFSGSMLHAERFVQLIGIFSPNTPVASNAVYATQIFNRAQQGYQHIAEVLGDGWTGRDVGHAIAYGGTLRQLAEAEGKLAEITSKQRPGGKGEADDLRQTIAEFTLDKQRLERQLTPKQLAKVTPEWMAAAYDAVKDSPYAFVTERNAKGSAKKGITGMFPDHAQKAEALMYRGENYEGRKTNNFYRNLMRIIDPMGKGLAKKQGATVDMHIMRSGGYVDDAPTDLEYSVAEKTIKKIAEKLRWEPQQVQAAIWESQKHLAERLMPAKAKIIDERMKLEDLINANAGKTAIQNQRRKLAEAERVVKYLNTTQSVRTKGFAEVLPDMAMNLTLEATPHPDFNVLKGLSDAPHPVRQQYTAEMHAAVLEPMLQWFRERIGAGFAEIGEGQGLYKGETNPGRQVRMTATQDAGSKAIYGMMERGMLDRGRTVARAVAHVLNQQCVGIHQVFASPTKALANAAKVMVYDGKLRPEWMDKSYRQVDDQEFLAFNKHLRDVATEVLGKKGMSPTDIGKFLDGAAIIPDEEGLRVLNTHGDYADQAKNTAVDVEAAKLADFRGYQRKQFLEWEKANRTKGKPYEQYKREMADFKKVQEHELDQVVRRWQEAKTARQVVDNLTFHKIVDEASHRTFGGDRVHGDIGRVQFDGDLIDKDPHYGHSRPGTSDAGATLEREAAARFGPIAQQINERWAKSGYGDAGKVETFEADQKAAAAPAGPDVRPAADLTEPGQGGESPRAPSSTQAIDAAIQKIETRAKTRQANLPRGRNVGGTTLYSDIADAASIAALKTIRAGIRGAEAIAAHVQTAIDTYWPHLKDHAAAVVDMAHRLIKQSTARGSFDQSSFDAARDQGPIPLATESYKNSTASIRPEERSVVRDVADAFKRDAEQAQKLGAVPPGLAKMFDPQFRETAGIKLAGVVGRLKGLSLPRLMAADKASGELGVETASARAYGVAQAQAIGRRVLGDDFRNVDFRNKLGAVLTEDQLRATRDKFIAEGDQTSANNVKSLVGTVFATEADYQAALKDPKVQAAIQADRSLGAPVRESLYRAAAQIDPTTPLTLKGKDTGVHISLRRVDDPNAPPPSRTAGAPGTLKKNSPFNRQRTGTGEYDTDYLNMLENSLARNAPVATLKQFYDRLIESGNAVEASPGQAPSEIKGEPVVAMAIQRGFLKPAATANNPTAGTVRNLYVRQSIAKEVLNAAGENTYGSPEALGTLANRVTSANMVIGLADQTTHIVNLTKALASSDAVGPTRFMAVAGAVGGIPKLVAALTAVGKQAVASARETPEVLDRVAYLTKIGAMRQPHAELPKNLGPVDTMVKGGMRMLGKPIEVYDRAARLALDEAFTRLVDVGLEKDTPQGRREFINQAGQYNARLQGDIVRFARQTGLGPFATAGTAFTRLGLRNLTLQPSSPTATGKQAAAQVALKVASLAGTVAQVAIINQLLHPDKERPKGVPIGSVWWKGDDGKPHYYDPLETMYGVRRGAKMLGVNQAINAYADGQEPSLDKGAVEAINQAMHPFLGPAVRTAMVSATGREPSLANARGEFRRVAPVQPDAGSQAAANLKAGVGASISQVYEPLEHASQEGTSSWQELAQTQFRQFLPKTGSNPQTAAKSNQIEQAAQMRAYLDELNSRAWRRYSESPTQRWQFAVVELTKQVKEGKITPQQKQDALDQLKRRGIKTHR